MDAFAQFAGADVPVVAAEPRVVSHRQAAGLMDWTSAGRLGCEGRGLARVAGDALGAPADAGSGGAILNSKPEMQLSLP